ncbi:hypothetical protein JXA32_09060 [Candidatus Sumerlaeota bacterium]|nr:hypothetical protein [Candidatus Sumerlaeota bacterium]
MFKIGKLAKFAEQSGRWINRAAILLLLFTGLVVLGVLGYAALLANRTIAELLTQNETLKTALANLEAESEIGYAKALSRTTVNGRTFTRVLFVETDPAQPERKLRELECEVEGDVVHFDALVARFDRQLVRDGKARSLYLWRRIYGENTPPAKGMPIQPEGQIPERYRALTRDLPPADRMTFWGAIWSLANDPERLTKLGVRGVAGNAVYIQLQPGKLYVFTINHAGGLEVKVENMR